MLAGTPVPLLISSHSTGYQGHVVVADDLDTVVVGTGGLPEVKRILQPAAEQT